MPPGAVEVVAESHSNTPPSFCSSDFWIRADQRCLDLEEGVIGMDITFPRCRKCGAGDLVPLSDFGSQGASIQFKAWVCTNPNCLFNIKIRNGDLIINEPVSDASMHPYRSAR
jgi:hypothetical protein